MTTKADPDQQFEGPLADHQQRYHPVAGGPPSVHYVSGAIVTALGNQRERIQVWNHGAYAGELVVNAGDGSRIALMLQLASR